MKFNVNLRLYNNVEFLSYILLHQQYLSKVNMYVLILFDSLFFVSFRYCCCHVVVLVEFTAFYSTICELKTITLLQDLIGTLKKLKTSDFANYFIAATKASIKKKEEQKKMLCRYYSVTTYYLSSK